MLITTQTIYTVQDPRTKTKQSFKSEGEAMQHIEDLLGKEIDSLTKSSGHWSPKHKLELLEWLQANKARLCDLLHIQRDWDAIQDDDDDDEEEDLD